MASQAITSTKAEPTVAPILHYFYGTSGARYFGHVAIGGKLPRGDYYLSYGATWGPNQGKIEDDGRPIYLEDEEEIYGGKSIALHLPLRPLKQIEKAIKNFKELDRQKYSVDAYNCAHAAQQFLIDAGYLTTKILPTLQPTPAFLAKYISRLIQEDLAKKREVILKDIQAKGLDKITELIENDIQRLNAQIANHDEAQKQAKGLIALKKKIRSASIQEKINLAELRNSMLLISKSLDSLTAKNLIQCLYYFPYEKLCSPMQESLKHPGLFIQLQRALDKAAVAGNQAILTAQTGEARVTLSLPSQDISQSLIEIITSANKEVLVMGYDLDKNTEPVNNLKNALDKLNAKSDQNNKIRIRILVDRPLSVASMFNNPINNNTMQEYLIQYPNLDFQYGEHGYKALGSYNSKMIIIDNHTAIIPSAGLNSNHKNLAGLATLIQDSELITYLRQDFISAWDSSYTATLAGKKTPIPSELQIPNTMPEANAQVFFLSKKAQGASRKHPSPYSIALKEAIIKARNIINLTTTQLNNPEVIQSLVEAIKRGVKVNIVITKNMNRASMAEKGNNFSAMQLLYDQIGQAHNKLDARWRIDEDNLNLIEAPGREKLPQLNMVSIDNEIIFTGSSSLNQQSFFHSREADLVIHSATVAKNYNERLFLPIFNKGISVLKDPEPDKNKTIRVQLVPNITIRHTNKNKSSTLVNHCITTPKQWYSVANTHIAFRIFQRNDNVNFKEAMEELRNGLAHSVLPLNAVISELPMLNDNQTRVSLHQALSITAASCLSFGIVEECIKPQEELTSQIFLPDDADNEESILLKLIEEQITQGLSALGGLADEKPIITINSLSLKDVLAGHHTLTPYEKAYIQYCLDKGLTCLGKDNTKPIAQDLLRSLIEIPQSSNDDYQP